MKKIRNTIKIFTLLMVLGFVSMNTISAKAVSGSEYETIVHYPEQSMSSYQKSYVYGIQTFLYWYDARSKAYIQNSGGCDGVYGKGTYDAVRYFQIKNKLTYSRTGEVDMDTWRALAKYATTPAGNDSAYTYYKGRMSNSPICLRTYTKNNIFSHWSYKLNGKWSLFIG